jgi:HPt (histidine-containing phosphotransfer) domain-containing protein
MTAHALKGDREHCLQSGMDDYVTKPIDPDKLFAVLEKYIAVEKKEAVKGEEGKVVPMEAASGSEGSPVDEAEIWKRVGEDRELLQELAGMFAADTPALVEAVRSSLKAKKAEELERSAHRLKGAVSTWSAQKAVELALKLEQTGRALKTQAGSAAMPDSYEEAQKCFEELEKELNRINLALESLSRKEAA